MLINCGLAISGNVYIVVLLDWMEYVCHCGLRNVQRMSALVTEEVCFNAIAACWLATDVGCLLQF